MCENMQPYKTRKWADKKFTEGADYNCKRYFITTSCHCNRVKLNKETLPQMQRYKFREDITGMKESAEKTWNEKYKRRSSFFRRYHHSKRLAELYNSELFKKNPCIPQMFWPNYNNKETPEEKQVMQNMTKEKVCAKLQLKKIRYERQLESVKQTDIEMSKLIKINFKEKIAIIM